MANREQLDILRRGVAEWNAWRKADPDIQPDLSGADLKENVDLSHVNLSRANLSRANLTDANLTEAFLLGADLTSADLTRADLSAASLVSTRFMRPHLWEVDLSRATLGNTVFVSCGLSTAKGLESCVHSGPSTLDYSTLARSGHLPLAFLRGVGLPDRLIEYLPSLLGEAIQFYACFISYSSKDQAFVERLHADLQNKGVRCWFAPHDLQIGAETRTAIDEAIRQYDKLLLVLSENSVRSNWVKKEVETAFEREDRSHQLVLFPIRLDNAVFEIESGWAADIRRMRNIGDMRQWKDHDAYQRAFERVLRDLRAENAQPSPSTEA